MREALHRGQCRGTNVRGTRCRIYGAHIHRVFCNYHAPRYYLTDKGQINRAKALFEWWWVRPQYPGQPEWEKCDPEIQAFWMDGAWEVSQHV